jgi:myosin heavy chain 9/10/11/14
VAQDIGFTDDEEMNILRTLAGILHLGNIRFLPTVDNSDGCIMDPETIVFAENACRLLGFDQTQFDTTLRKRFLRVGTEVTLRPQKDAEVRRWAPVLCVLFVLCYAGAGRGIP